MFLTKLGRVPRGKKVGCASVNVVGLTVVIMEVMLIGCVAQMHTQAWTTHI